MATADRSPSRRVTPADVLGAPVLPPTGAVAGLTAVRARLAGLRRRMTPPPVAILDGVLGLVGGAALGALCRLGIPDVLDGPMTLDELARRVDADRSRVEPLVRYAAVEGWVRVDRSGRVRPTSTTRFLRRDHPGGWRHWVDFATGPEVFAALSVLADDARVADPFAAANGQPFFDWYSEHPDRQASFDGAMAAGGRLHGLALSAALEWDDVARVCDVGGGDGALVGVLVGQHPNLQAVVLDLPTVVARAEPHPSVELVGGDAFRAVPEGCDRYLLVNVVHDWGDEAVVELLSRIGEAKAAPVELVVVEGRYADRPTDSLTTATDVLMMTLTNGGQERSTDQLTALARRAGLTLVRTVPLVSGDDAHILI